MLGEVTPLVLILCTLLLEGERILHIQQSTASMPFLAIAPDLDHGDYTGQKPLDAGGTQTPLAFTRKMLCGNYQTFYDPQALHR